MAREVLTASPSDSTADCIRVMTEKRVRHLPVLLGTKMIGIVSIGDVMKWLISAQAEEIERIHESIEVLCSELRTYPASLLSKTDSLQ